MRRCLNEYMSPPLPIPGRAVVERTRIAEIGTIGDSTGLVGQKIADVREGIGRSAQNGTEHTIPDELHQEKNETRNEGGGKHDPPGDWT